MKAEVLAERWPPPCTPLLVLAALEDALAQVGRQRG
jgi:hypothetical protein